MKLVIIGGVAAGMSAAAKARRTDPNISIEVFTDEQFISYAGCGLPYFIGNKISSKDKLLARSIEQFMSQNINVTTQTKVIDIHKENKTITAKNLLNGEVTTKSFDKLIIATGARPVMPPIEGIDLNGIFPLRTINDSLNIQEYFLKHKPQKAVIIGGGYIGLEMVENLLEYDCEITLIEQHSHIIPNMDEDMAKIAHDYITAQNVTIKTGERVIKFEGQGRVEKVITDKGVIEADFVLLSIGVQPNSELAKNAGLELGVKNAIKVNNRMETSFPDIYAAGDCASTTHLVSGQEVYIPMGTTANKQGRTAGENAAGGKAIFNGVLGTGIAQIIDLEIARTGLSERECKNLDIDYISHTIKSKTAAHYYPVTGDIWVKIIIDKQSRLILGSQIVGFKGAAKRIDVLAAAITAKATIDDLKDMDLAYSPPFSPVWDPVLIAINQF